MTREEAIKILDPETRLEYLVEVEYKARLRGAGAVADAMKEALDMAIAALREQESLEKKQATSNGDRIRAMSDEELAEKMCDHRLTKDMWLNWLRKPYKEDT